ncbi:Pseudouridine synthase [Dirofilaria immitis]|nr:Pseudouridine synthase [Dirofilaria immitis]
MIEKNGFKTKKRKREEIDVFDEMPENISIRYLSPYWSVYHTRAKGRWVGRRLIDIFTEEFVSLSPHYTAAACKLGRIWVNCNQMTDVNYIVQHNDSIEHIGHRHEHPILDQYIRVIDNDNNILVVDKPPSMPVHPCGRYCVHTVLGMLRNSEVFVVLEEFAELFKIGKCQLNVVMIVHRLDRTTSGVLLFARNAETDIKLKRMLRVGEIWHKEYVCKVEGVFPGNKEIVCDRPIGPLILSMGVQCIREDGKYALTRFSRLWTDGQTSIVRCMLETGRTHQIRVHLQYLGYPIVDDYIYNTDAWGATRGKDGNYGKSLEQLRKDVIEEHKASNWHEQIDPEYENRVKQIAEGKVQPESEGLNTKTKEWSYSSEIPHWAIQPNDMEDLRKASEDLSKDRHTAQNC